MTEWIELIKYPRETAQAHAHEGKLKRVSHPQQ
jgi:hypothetical protein